jgi:hypothetical protein
MLTQHPGDLAIEGFTCMIVFKNVFSFGLTLRAFEWLVQSGTKAKPLFTIVASVQIVICLLSIPMCKSICHASMNCGLHEKTD